MFFSDLTSYENDLMIIMTKINLYQSFAQILCWHDFFFTITKLLLSLLSSSSKWGRGGVFV